MALISLTGIKYRSKSRSAQTSIGGFPNYGIMDIAEAFASALNPSIERLFLPNSALSTASSVGPIPNIKPNSLAANSIAEISEHFIFSGNPRPVITESIASVTSPTILEQIPITIPSLIASILEPIVQISVTIGSVSATASIISPSVFGDKIINSSETLATASTIAPTITVPSGEPDATIGEPSIGEIEL